MSTTALLLHRVPLFASLDSDDLERIVRTTRVETHRSATVIIREGDLDDRRFYVVAQGRVAVLKHYGTKQQRHLNELGPGAFFGEMALLGDAPRSATVVARGQVELLCLDQFDLLEVLEDNPRVAVVLLQTLANRLRAVERYLVETLGGFVPICANCKRIREEDGRWTRIEEYISARSDVTFSHCVCPECDRLLYDD